MFQRLIFATSLTCALVAAHGCGPDCGEGTLEEDGSCTPAYPERTCGPDTLEKQGSCTPAYPRRTCGPDTLEKQGKCVPAYPKRTCGPDTVLVQGKCVLDKNTGSCSPGTKLKGKACVPAHVQDVKLPFASGAKVSISQGFLGYFSHYGDSRYAVDFRAKEGTTTVAARGGIVLAVKEDSNTGCSDPKCGNQANYVVIDHGDATFSNYWHLQLNGAKVKVGDQVCAGQPVGLTGNTGYSTGPHLHFAVKDSLRLTLPLSFEELNSSSGKPVSGPTYVSGNKAPAKCAAQFKYSTCPRDIFEHRGVRLDAGVPCAAASRGSTSTISGKVLVNAPAVALKIKPAGASTWKSLCEPVEKDGTFSIQVTWTSTAVLYSNLLVTAVDANCKTYEGWNKSVRVYLR